MATENGEAGAHQPALTIAVPTRNRAASLHRLLSSLEAMQKPPALTFEILVVLNACEDDSRAVAERFQDRLPVRIVDEPRIGISAARNAGVDHARASLIAWIDDDVVVDRDWLIASARAFADDPDAAVYGGAIEPLFEGDVKPWFRDHWRAFGDVFGLRRPPAGDIEPTDPPYGANFAIRTHWLRGFRFDDNLGRRDSYLLHGMEETDLIARLLAQGARGRWIPAARVQHVVPPQRRTLRYIFRYYAGHGFYLGRQDATQGNGAHSGVVAGAALLHAAAFLTGRVLNRPARWTASFREMSVCVGRLAGRMARAQESVSVRGRAQERT